MVTIIFVILISLIFSTNASAIYYGNITSDINGFIVLSTYSSSGGACISGIPCEKNRTFSESKIHPIVYIASKTHLYAKPSIKSKQLITLQKGSVIKVWKNDSYYWEKVIYHGKTGYVMDKRISMDDPIKYQSYNLQPYNYDYKYQIESNDTVRIFQLRNPELLGRPQFMAISLFSRYYSYENHEGLQVNRINNYIFKYPFKVGKTWTYNDIYDNKKRIKSIVVGIDRTIETPLKTFKHVVEIQQSNGESWYLAKNVGVIKIVSADRTSMLIK